MNNYVNMMKLAAYIEGRSVDMRKINNAFPAADGGLCVIGHARDLWGDEMPPFSIRLGLGVEEKYTSLICPEGWEHPPAEQKERVLALLRGQIKLTPDWLHNPEWQVETMSMTQMLLPLEQEAPCTTS